MSDSSPPAGPRLLAAALCVGAAGAFCRLRAAHGRPYARRLSESEEARGRPLEVEDHDEALASARHLRAGIILTCLCTALLVTAVGVTLVRPAEEPSAIDDPAGHDHTVRGGRRGPTWHGRAQDRRRRCDSPPVPSRLRHPGRGVSRRPFLHRVGRRATILRGSTGD